MFFFKAYVSIIEALKWSSFVVLYEESEGLVRLQEVLKMTTSKRDITINVRQLIPSPVGDYRYLLLNMSDKYTLNLLYLSTN